VHTAGTGLQRPPRNQPGRRTAPDPPEVTPSQHRPYSGFDSCHVQLPAVSLEQHLTDAPAAMARLVHDLDVEHVADEPDPVAHVVVHRRTAGHELEDARALAVVLADDLGDAGAGPGAAAKQLGQPQGHAGTADHSYESESSSGAETSAPIRPISASGREAAS